MIGTLQAFALACGLLFVSLYAGFLNGVTALLFGNFLGITDAQVATLAVVTAVCARGDRASCTGRCCSRRSIPTSPPRAGSALAGFRCCSSSCSASRWPRPRRSRARCSCSRCSSCPPRRRRW